MFRTIVAGLPRHRLVGLLVVCILLASTALLSTVIRKQAFPLPAIACLVPPHVSGGISCKIFYSRSGGDMFRLSAHTRLFALLCCLVLATVTWFYFPRTAVHAATSFTPQTRLGFPAGDDWEPA